MSWWNLSTIYTCTIDDEGYEEIAGTWSIGSWCRWYRVSRSISNNLGKVSWTLGNIGQGQFKVKVRFFAHENRCRNVEYRIYDKDVLLDIVVIDQKSHRPAIKEIELGSYYFLFREVKVVASSTTAGYFSTGPLYLISEK